MQNKLQEIQNLENKIVQANVAYAKGIPILTDTEYDILWQKLRSIAPDNPYLYHTANNKDLPYNEYRHKFQLYSPQKAFDLEELKPFMTRFGNEKLILEPKYDGCAAVFYLGKEFEDDKLILEGNGISGRDISHHLPYIFGTFEPKAFNSIELIIPWKNWEEKYGKNPRNTVAGWIARKDISNYHHVIEMVSHNHGNLSKEVTYTGNLDSLYEIILSCYQQWSKLYPIDGIMIKVSDEKRRIISGNNGTTYAWSIAWKPPMQTKETKVTDIKWNVSRNGRVVPTIYYEPIELCGTVNKKVTGNNATWLEEKGIFIGSNIVVGKAGEIIPKVVEVKKTPENKVLFPFGVGLNVSGTTIHGTNKAPQTSQKPPLNQSIKILCPVCNSELTKNNKDFICSSLKCFAQYVKTLAYFYSDKGMEVKTIGENMLFDLLQDPELFSILKNYPYALLDPKSFNLLEKIKSIWGEKRTENYLSALNEIKNKKTLIDFISALGYPGLSNKTASKLYYYVKYKKAFSSVSAKARKNYQQAYLIFLSAENKLKNFSFASVPPPPEIIYCITGTLSEDRKDFIHYLSSFGWQFNNTVTKTTNYLISGDKPGKTKTTAAKQKGIKIINEEQLKEIINAKQQT